MALYCATYIGRYAYSSARNRAYPILLPTPTLDADGDDERSRWYRHSIIRYSLLAYIIVLRFAAANVFRSVFSVSIKIRNIFLIKNSLFVAAILVLSRVSVPVKRRFPTMGHLVTAGLITDQELEVYESVKSPYCKYWLPIRFALRLAKTARTEKRISSELLYDKIVDVCLES